MKILIMTLVAIVLVGIGGLFYLGQKSGSGTAPGLQAGQLTACPSSPNCVSSEANTPQEQKVDPLPLAVWGQIPSVVEDMGGTVTRNDSNYIAAEFTSSLFKFTDDVEFRRSDDAVHVRSASRVGYSDMGTNGERVAKLRERLMNL
jgi:uncharacterized protein (DUF1499 family)